MEKKVFFEGEFGKICGVLHAIDKTSEIVIIVHGFSSTKNTAAAILAPELNKIGLNALRIDLDNQGESEMDFKSHVSIPNNVKQINTAIAYCKSLGYETISLIGGSFGGISCFAVALERLDIKRMCLRAPVVDHQKHLLRRYGEKKMNEFAEKGLILYKSSKGSDFEYSYNAYTSAKSYSMYDRASEVEIPTLIIQGTEDEAVAWKWAEDVIDLFPQGKLCIIEGADHGLAVDSDFSLAQQVLLDFFKE